MKVLTEESSLARLVRYQAKTTPGESLQQPRKNICVYNATVKNLNTQDRNINEFNFKLRDTDGNVYDVDLGSTAANGAMKGVTSTQPGDQVRGTIAFLVPQGATPKTVTYNDREDQITINL